jgi:hypothetical protein
MSEVEVRPDLQPADIDWLNAHAALSSADLTYSRTRPIPETCRAPDWRDCSKIRGAECMQCLPRTPEEARQNGAVWREEWLISRSPKAGGEADH